MHTGWGIYNKFDQQFAYPDFTSFVRAVTQERPGWVSNRMEAFVGPAENPYVHFVGRQEYLADDLVEALNLAGEQFDEGALRSTPQKNLASVTMQWKDQCLYTSEIIDLVCNAEHKALERFGYDFESTIPFRMQLLSHDNAPAAA